MKPVLLRYLACPGCGSDLECASLGEKSVTLSAEEKLILQGRQIHASLYETEIMRGRLSCRQCNARFPIHDGVPRLYKDAEKDFPLPEETALSSSGLVRPKDDKFVQTTFSREWDDFDYEDQTIWHWTLDERIATFCEELGIGSGGELRGKLMVDAGCGSAILSMNLAHRYGVEIIAMDLSFVLSRAFRQCKSNLCHFIQASVLAPPLKPGIADVTHSHGVLMHTSDTKQAFDAVEKLTKPGGLLYVWIYGKKKGWNRIKYMVIRTIRGITARLPKIPQTGVIHALALFHVFTRGVKKLTGHKVASIDSFSQLLVVTRDRYTPKYAREHTEAEIRGWFQAKGYAGIHRQTEWKTVDVWNGSTDVAMRAVRPPR